MEIRTSQGTVVPITNVLMLLVLMVITGLLISIYFQQRSIMNQQQVLAAAPEPVPSPVMPAVAPPTPLAAAPIRRAAPAATRNYTPAQLSPAPAVAPALVAVATPTPVYAAPAYVPTAPAPTPGPAYTPSPATYPDPLDRQQRRVDVTIPSGTVLAVRLIDTLNSNDLRAGDRFRATLDAPIHADGMAVAAAGSTVEGRVVDAQQAGRVSGVAELRVELDRLMLSNGQTVTLLTDTVTEFGETSKKADVAKVGAGTAIGAVLGAIGGGGKGAAIGAASGAGAGTAGVLLTRGRPVILTPETRLSFQLRSPVSVNSVAGFDPDYRYAGPSGANLPADIDRQRPILRRR